MLDIVSFPRRSDPLRTSPCGQRQRIASPGTRVSPDLSARRPGRARRQHPGRDHQASRDSAPSSISILSSPRPVVVRPITIACGHVPRTHRRYGAHPRVQPPHTYTQRCCRPRPIPTTGPNVPARHRAHLEVPTQTAPPSASFRTRAGRHRSMREEERRLDPGIGHASRAYQPKRHRSTIPRDRPEGDPPDDTDPRRATPPRPSRASEA